MTGASPPAKGLRAIVLAMRSWRTASVAVMSFASGLPLGLVYVAIPDWMRSIGVDLKVVGLITLAQAPWSFKVLWAPLLDRYVPPFLGRRRGWAAIAQVGLFATTLALAGVARHPDAPFVIGALALAIAFAAATQDIAVDAYAVDVLRPEEQGVAAGFRTASYFMAMRLAGAFAITFAAWTSWPLVLVVIAVLFLVLIVATSFAPKPEEPAAPPRTLREAVWQPFVGFLSRPLALQILGFVLCYKLSDVMANALLRPFLHDMGYNEIDRGVVLGLVTWASTAVGALFGGVLTTAVGVGRALWIFGIIQSLVNIGYVAVAMSAPNRILMLSATGLETLASGMGTGAFSVLLLRLTSKRFSATQYSLMSSLFALPRIISGPICGIVVDAVGWVAYFWLSVAAGIPGLLLLRRFAPLGGAEPDLQAEARGGAEPITTRALTFAGVGAGVAVFLGATLMTAVLGALKGMRATPPLPFDLARPLLDLVSLDSPGDVVRLAGLFSVGAIGGLFTAAVLAAKRTVPAS
ncbi:MAG TPA: MFS transporter [Candidatus Polarisedimenticolaceae bacterium]|nr:MFS transporter [Candidatus Polarisedimenticolaceae bacterium]